MSFDSSNKQWGCGKTGAVKLQRIVRDIREPCLHQSPIKVTRMLKPEKWHAAFDSEGKVCGFQKILKLIRLGGVDPSIRAEVWEFLLGCYALNSTAEYRMKLRTARRERYEELLNECQNMHASVGTGLLAFVVGSKVMDMRTYSKNIQRKEPEPEDRQASSRACSRSNDCCNHHDYPDKSYSCQRDSSGDSSDLISVRGSVDSAAYDSSSHIPTPAEYHCDSINFRTNTLQSQYMVENLFDFPALPVTNLFGNDGDRRECESCDSGRLTQHELSSDDDTMHSFKINNNEDLIMESNGSVYASARPSSNSVIEMTNSNSSGSMLRSTTQTQKSNMENIPGLSDAPEIPVGNTSTSGRAPDGNRVSEWLWTLHRIVVDVVRTDSNLEFYEDPKNLARMSDILAVYAWVDPQTGYCQGMSDILSPFVVLFEDDADAFWCFEMLLGRMRENFQMEGPTGVMKQLLMLWHILELTDREMFSHLSHIGAESLHFAFRMLLVLFRRELSFNEALCMWEMMWAADFNDSMAWNTEQNCLEPLLLQLPGGCGPYVVEEIRDSDDSLKCESQGKQASIEDSIENAGMNSVTTSHSFCGLTRSIWSKNDRLPIYTETLSSRNREDQLPVFCVAAVLMLNRHKIIKEARSIEDLIKIFNDNVLKIKVKSCIRTAVKLRRKYFYKIRSGSPVPQNIPLD